MGYKPADITYLGLSHYHSDHTANDFAGSTWLVHQGGALKKGPDFYE